MWMVKRFDNNIFCSVLTEQNLSPLSGLEFKYKYFLIGIRVVN